MGGAGRTVPGGPPRAALVFGAGTLGRPVIDALLREGWRVAAATRSDAGIEAVRASGAVGLRADVTDPVSVEATLGEAAAAFGPLGLVVNAAAAYGGDRRGPFGGGPLIDARVEAFDAWTVAPARAAFAFLSATGRFLLAQGVPSTVVQATGGSARRAMPGRGLWAAGSFGVRALTQAAALELRGEGIHVALLVIDAGIEDASGPPRPGVAPQALADPERLADTVLFLAEQGARAATHELQVTPLAERWVP
jgi:NAD(P)-dependent dehydrogenase (short-subunit alcohol dehydrogenase family)